MSCSICQHPKRHAIDQALIAGSATLAALSQQYGLSTSALHRHKAHLQARCQRAQDLVQDHLRQGCLFWLSQALEMIMQTAKAAQTDGNGKLALKALAQGTRLITIILKQDIQLDPRIVYELLSSPQWADQPSLLPPDPGLMSMSRQSLAGGFGSPCPEDDALPASPGSTAELDLMQQLLQGLAAFDGSAPEGRQQRAKGGKSPGKTPGRKGNAKECQKDTLWQKISGLVDFSSLTRPLSPATPDSNLDAILQELADGGTMPSGKPLSEQIYEKSLHRGRDQKTAGPGCRP
jgi:hypothetical protein